MLSLKYYTNKYVYICVQKTLEFLDHSWLVDRLCQILTKTTTRWQKCEQKQKRRGRPFAWSLPSVAAICFFPLDFTIYISIHNLHLLFILAVEFTELADASEFTKAIHMQLKRHSLWPHCGPCLASFTLAF